jgi:hypothetical protein
MLRTSKYFIVFLPVTLTTVFPSCKNNNISVPMVPPEGGEFYFVDKDKPADAPSLKINLAEETTFPADKGISFTGSTTADSVYFAAVMPGPCSSRGRCR